MRASSIDQVKRLLDEGVLAHPHGHRPGGGVGVVGRADGDGVDLVAHLLEHLAVVDVLLGVGELGRHLVELGLVDVAEGDDLAVLAGVVGVALPLAADADAGEPDLLARRFLTAEGRASEDRAGHARHRGLAEEVATIRIMDHGCGPPGECGRRRRPDPRTPRAGRIDPQGVCPDPACHAIVNRLEVSGSRGSKSSPPLGASLPPPDNRGSSDRAQWSNERTD